MRTVAAGLLAALRTGNPDIVRFVQIDTGSSPATLYLSDRAPRTWNGNAYVLRPLEFPDELRSDNQGEVNRVSLHVANADRYFQGLIAAGATFERRRVRVYSTEASRLDASPAEYVPDVFYIESWTFTEGLFTLDLLNRYGAMDVGFPRGRLLRSEFRGLPRNASGL